MPENINKPFNVDLLCELKVRRLTHQRDGQSKVVKVPLAEYFRQKQSKAGDGMSAEEVAAEVRGCKLT